MISLQNIKIGYLSSHRFKQNEPMAVFSDINLKASSRQSIALIGQNGIGKSTLLRTIANLQNAISGKILINNKLISEYKQHEIAKIISYVSTNNANIPNLTVSELIALGRFPHTNWIGNLKNSDKQIISKALEITEIKHLENKSINQISDGEKQRVMIARALAQNTDIIILDEPTAFLDIANKHHLSFIINKLSKEENKLVIFSTHDLNIAIKYADTIWLMLPDKIITGSPEDLILEKQFSLIFKNKNIIFDDFNADFNFDKKIVNQVQLIIDKPKKSSLNKKMELYQYWTKKAFERIGYEIKQNAKISVILKQEENKIVWQTKQNKKIETHKTIAELLETIFRINL